MLLISQLLNIHLVVAYRLMITWCAMLHCVSMLSAHYGSIGHDTWPREKEPSSGNQSFSRTSQSPLAQGPGFISPHRKRTSFARVPTLSFFSIEIMRNWNCFAQHRLILAQIYVDQFFSGGGFRVGTSSRNREKWATHLLVWQLVLSILVILCSPAHGGREMTEMTPRTCPKWGMWWLSGWCLWTLALRGGG